METTNSKHTIEDFKINCANPWGPGGHILKIVSLHMDNMNFSLDLYRKLSDKIPVFVVWKETVRSEYQEQIHY